MKHGACCPSVVGEMTSKSIRVIQHDRCSKGPRVQPPLTSPTLLPPAPYSIPPQTDPCKLCLLGPHAFWFLVRFLWETCSGDWQAERGRNGVSSLPALSFRSAVLAGTASPFLWFLSMAHTLHGAPGIAYLLLVPAELGVARAFSISSLWGLSS